MTARKVWWSGAWLEIGGGGGGSPTTPSAWEALGADTSANSRGTAITTGGANTKGSWTQLDASTAEDTALLVVAVRMVSSGSHSFHVDIGTGAPASETPVISNLLVTGNPTGVVPFQIPVAIPAGTRISARASCSTATQTCYVMAYAQEAGPLVTPSGAPATYGATTASTAGTSVDPGGSAGTKGAWSQLTAATSGDIDAIVVNIGGQRNTARTLATWLIDIGTGPGGSESILIPNLFVGSAAGSEIFGPVSIGPLLVPTIASGTRLAARAQCATIDATDRLLDVQVVGS